MAIILTSLIKYLPWKGPHKPFREIYIGSHIDGLDKEYLEKRAPGYPWEPLALGL